MDCRIFPFGYNSTNQPLETVRATLIQNLEVDLGQTQATIALSNRDYEMGEEDTEDIAEVSTKFKHMIHGIQKYKFLSDSVLHVKFHSELEEPLSGLSPTFKRYEEHHTRITIPPKFNKPFILVFKDATKGLLIAPFGTPRRVEYIIGNLGKSLGFEFKKEIIFTPEKMDALLDKLNKDNKRIKSISWVSATVVDNGSHEHYGFEMGNIRNFIQLENLRKNYVSFKLNLIKFTANYKSGVDQTVKITLRSKPNDAVLSLGLNSRTLESKRDVFQWIGELFLQ